MPIPTNTRPPAMIILRSLKKCPNFAPNFTPIIEASAVTIPIKVAANKIFRPLIAREAPTAQASILVATANTNRFFRVNGFLMFFASSVSSPRKNNTFVSIQELTPKWDKDDKQLPGGNRNRQFELTAKNPGVVKIRLEEKRQWEANRKSSEDFEITVRVVNRR